jgi:hypothetical protein
LATAGAAALSVVGGTAHAGAHVGSGEQMGVHVGAHLDGVGDHERSRPPIVSTNTGHADAREHARALAEQAVGRGEQPSATAIAQAVNKPRSTVARWIVDVGAPIPDAKPRRKRATA